MRRLKEEPGRCSLDLANDSLSACTIWSEEGASIDLSNPKTGENWTQRRRRQPLFAWRFDDKRDVISSLSGWSTVNVTRSSQPDGIDAATVVLSKPGVKVTTVLQLYPGNGPLRVSTAYRDLSPNPTLQSPCESFRLTLTPPEPEQLELLYVKKGTTRPDVLRLQRDPLHDGEANTIYCSGSDDRDDVDCFPWFCFQRGDKSGAYFGWEFSGYGRFDAVRRGHEIQFSGGLEPAKFIKRGSVDLPAWFVGFYQGNEDDGANALHHWWMGYRFPRIDDPLYPRVHYNTWTALGTEVDEQRCLAQIAMARKLGAELFHIDAGWYRGIDDWVPDRKKFPNGLGEVIDAARRAGMKFGLWTAPNHASLRLCRQHPDWVINEEMVDSPQSRAAASSDVFTGIPMCWGHESVEKYLAEELDRIVRDYQLDYLEHDQPIVLDCRRDDAHTHHLGGGQYELVRAYYRTYDGLRKKYPELMLEDCMSGGHIMDYGVMQRFHLISITDLFGPLENRQAVWGATFPMPPSYCEMYMEDTDLPAHYQFRSFMMGLWALSADTTKWSLEKVKACQDDIAAYKRIRPIIRDGNVYHVLPQPDGKHWDGMEYYHPQTGKGVLFVFRPDSEESKQIVTLRGLDPAASYAISFEDSARRYTATGAELMETGTTVVLPEKFGSEIVYFEVPRGG